MVLVTWDSVNKGSNVILSNGNLTAVVPNYNNNVRASLGRTAGKWYWEVKVDALTASLIGISNGTASLTSMNYNTQNVRFIAHNDGKYPEGISYGTKYIVGDVIGVALDLDNGTLEFYKNGISYGFSHTNIKSMGEVFPALSTGSSGAGFTSTTNFGATPFSYSIPVGYMSYDGNQRGKINKILLLSNDKTYSLDNGKILDTDPIPKFTSENSNLPIKAISSSNYSSDRTAWKAFNKEASASYSSWGSSTNTTESTPQWIGIDFSSYKTIGEYTIVSSHSSYDFSPTYASPKDWTFEGSNDGLKWYILDKQTNVTDWSDATRKTFSIKKPKPFKMYRLHATSAVASNYILAIGELEMKECATSSIKSLPSHSKQNFIDYGMDSPVKLDGVFESKNYILQDTVSEDTDGLWKAKVDRKPLSIRFN